MKARAPAKINLSLRVLGVRADGYHELRTIFQSVALHDVLTIRARRGPFVLQCDDPACPNDESNLVWRAAQLMWTASGRRGQPRDVAIALTKRIPLAAGLGGGSSDAAAAVRALGSLWRVGRERWMEIGTALGADVPYFLEGGTVLGLGRGDELYPLAAEPSAWVTIVVPTFGVRTADAYAWWDEVRSSSDEGSLRNDLEEPVGGRHPDIPSLARALARAGAWHAAMSGSGAAVFGLFADRRAATRGAAALARSRMVARALVTRTLNRAAYQRLAGIEPHRIHLPFAPRSWGHS
jgi:4-diphosphocytidyl-2-C-methyl-D-erythritol kinase